MIPGTEKVNPIDRLTEPPWWFRPEKDISSLSPEDLKALWITEMEEADCLGPVDWDDPDWVQSAAQQIAIEGACVEVDWSLQGPLEEEIEKLGCVSMLSLTQGDVLRSYPWMTEGEIEDVLSRIRRKHEWNWIEILDIYVSGAYDVVLEKADA